MTAAAACHKMPLTAPSGTAITLIASTNVLPVNGSTDVIAILIEGGQSTTGNNTTTNPGVGTPVHNGTLVTFTTSLGRIEPVEARTEGGRATVKLFADGRSGTATVTAFSGPATKTLEVAIGAAAAARVVLTASPQALPSSGGQTTITARVEDAQGNGLLGVPVSFTTTAGSLSATSGLTNGDGLATTTLTSTAAATVTGNAGGSTGTVAVTLKPRTDLTITPPAAAVVSTPAVFTFGVSGTGTSVSNATVDWGDGSASDLGSLAGTRSVTHLFSRSGALDVTLSGTDAEGVRVTTGTSIVVTALTITVSASTTSPTLGTPVSFIATVTPAGASIDRYEWDFGDGGETKTSQSPQTTYSFQSRGTKTVTVRAIPTRGSAITAITQVEVK